MEERRRDDDARAVDLAELEGEPTWRADVLFDRTCCAGPDNCRTKQRAEYDKPLFGVTDQAPPAIQA